MQTKESIDLMNIEYEDVLHLYRGWRKSESALKDKDKELATLKERVRQLQDSHSKFRSQIQSLESVKELTISLQSSLKTLQQENFQLKNDNEELVLLNEEAEKLLQEKEEKEIKQSSLLHNVQLEFANLKGRYEETTKAFKDLEQLANEEQAMRMSLEQRLANSDGTIEELREENRQLRTQLDATRHRVEQCDQELLLASEQLSSISREVLQINITKDQLANAEAEVGVLKGDISRLLRLFEQSPAMKEFFYHWNDSKGMDFVGMEGNGGGASSSARNSFTKTTGNSINPMLDNTTFRIDHKEYDPSQHDLANELSELALSKFELTPAEFANLKRIHGGDPFPMTSTVAEEQEYWVPSDAARLGVKFMHAKFPEAPQTVIMDFLRNMNKIWLRRERRKVKRVKSVLGATIDDLKRQISQMKPYKGVIQERQIRRLKSQVRTERTKVLTGRAKSKLEQSTMDKECFQEVDFEYPDMPHERRLCRQAHREKLHTNADITMVSTEKLLQASLTSLHNIGKRVQHHDATRSNYDVGNEPDDDFDVVAGDHEVGMSLGSRAKYPSASYLRGALWIGRNMTLVTEELAESLDNYRNKYLSDVADISRDGDFRRACHRLTLLASSGMNQVVLLATKSKQTIREMLEGTASLEPGNSSQLQRFLRTLPIESALTSSSRAASPMTARGIGNGMATINSAHSTIRSHSAPNSPNRSRYSTLGSPLHATDLANR